jgi:thymidylate synthase
MHFVAATSDDVLRELYPALLERGTHVEASRGANSELIGVQLQVEAPRARLSRTETRGRPFSALGEFLWYLTKDNRLDFVQPLVLPYAKQGLIGEVYDSGRVLSAEYDETGRVLRVRGLPGAIAQLRRSLAAH